MGKWRLSADTDAHLPRAHPALSVRALPLHYLVSAEPEESSLVVGMWFILPLSTENLETHLFKLERS